MRARWIVALWLACVTALGACSNDDHEPTLDADIGPSNGDAGIDPGDAGDGAVDASLAPPLNRTVPTDFASSFGFIFDGPNATQTGVTAGAIDPRRMAIVRGRVLDAAANPVAGVTISVIGQPQLGSTRSKPDGSYDLAVNGGGSVRVSFVADQYLPLERELKPVWNAFERARDVFLSKLDTTVSEVTLGAGQALQVAGGSKVGDRSGERTGTLFFGAGTTATVVLANGSEVPLTTAHVRVTEYTAGDNGPKAMPASLPPQSGYTYAVELTVDEAQAMGGREVKFSKPVPYYVENFLRIPVGEPVPSGYLNRERGEWVTSPSGRVIKLMQPGQVDLDGDDKPDTLEALAALGIDADELAALATKYSAGTSLWRVPLPHFSAWDFNWCFFGALFDAVSDLFDNRPLNDSCTANGSIIECENQTLGEAFAVAGAPYGLYYRSDRVPGRRDAFRFEVQLTGVTVPRGAKRVRLELDVLGQHITHVADATPNQRYQFDWDGRDAYGRVWQGPALARYRVGYVFDGWYGHTPTFGAYGEIDRTRWDRAPDNQFPRPPGVTAEDDLARLETTMWLGWQDATLGTFDAAALGFGGLTLGVHHTYDPASHTLYLGTGERRRASSDTRAVRALLGAVGNQADASGQARHTRIDAPHGVAVAADGTVFVSLEQQHRVIRIDRNGVVQPVAGSGSAGYSGDGGAATGAALNQPLGLALAKDGTLYIAERLNKVVRRVSPGGVIDTFAGNPMASADDGADKPARTASFGEPHAVAVGLDGSVFVADAQRNNVRRVRSDGVIETVLGSRKGEAGATGDGGPGTKALLSDPLSVAVGPDGSIYVAEFDGHRIRRLAPDGSVLTVAGTGTAGGSGDGGPATAATLNQPHTVDVGPDGALYITDEGNHVLRRVRPDGIIETIAGGGDTRAEDFTPARDASFQLPRITVVEPNGNLLVADYDGDFVYRVLPFLPSASPDGAVIANEDGTAYYQFDASGRHQKSVDARTQQTLWSFQYDGAGRLSAVLDDMGRALQIERDPGSQLATRLLSPDGLESRLTHAANGWLGSVGYAEGESTKLAFSDQGLLLSETDAAGRVHGFSYDATGRLLKDTEISGAFQSLERAADKSKVTKRDALGRATSYERKQVDGVDTLVVTGPDGLASTRKTSRTTTTLSSPDGSETSVTLAADPRFGMQAAYPSSVRRKLPSGLVSELRRTRKLTLTNPEDPNTLSTLTETLVVPGRGTVQTVYDATKRSERTIAGGESTVTQYDAMGRVAQVTPPAGAPINYEYDPQGRVSQIAQGARVFKHSYDVRGFLAGVTDPLGTEYAFDRDALGRLIGSRVGGREISKRRYVPGGDPTTLTTPGAHEYSFQYDGGGRVAALVSPSFAPGVTDVVRYGYEADDFLASVTLPSGARTQVTRDSSGRLASFAMPEGTVTYRYDERTGALVAATLDAETLGISWDGPLPTTLTAAGTVASSVTLQYDAALRVSSDTVAGVSSSYSYDNAGRLTQAGLEKLSYADLARVSGRSLGVVAENYGYSRDFAELSTQKVTASSALFELSITRDLLGRIVSQTETIQGEATTSNYAYDALGRLSGVTDASGSHAYSYDDNGNRLDPGASFDAQDRLIRRAEVSYEYTPDGSLARRVDASGTRELSYDTRGQLRRFAQGGREISYVIDALGRRVGKKIDGTLAQAFVYDLNGRLLAELDARGALLSRFVYGSRAHVPDYLVRAGTTYAIIADPRGSPRLVVDTTSGQVAQRVDYDAWGNVLRDSQPGFQPFGFAGGLWDPDTRLVRFGSRDYDAELGRWTNKDPAGFGGGGGNLYEYAASDPINRIDADGHIPILVPVIIGAATSAGLDIGIQLALNGGNFGCIDWGQVATSAAVGGLFGGVGKLLARSATAASEAWALKPFARGVAIENALGRNLPGNFPVIDRFANGVATSIKSIDLGAKSYQEAATLTRTVTGYIDKVAAFSGRTWGGASVPGSQITGRALELAIPAGGGSAAQQTILQSLVQYGQSVGVVVKIIPF